MSEEKARNIAKVGHGDVVIAARRLSFWYGQVIGINDISIDICQGVIGLLGPNGAGKSTLFKVLTGQLQPATGSVSILSEKVWQNAATFARIGFVPEQDAFYEEMTGFEFVTYLTRLQGFEKADAQKLAEEAIEQVDLTAQKDKEIREYSKGMRQRIKIAQALAHKPKVLFLDEPLQGTDPVGRKRIIDIIKKLGDSGHTVLVSSHILHEVELMTQSILLINKGRVVADGGIQQIREMIDAHPHTIFINCPKPREFAAILSQFEDIVRIDFVENGFQVATTSPDTCYGRIPKLALEHDFELRAMTSHDNNLMAIFNYLIQ